MIARENLPDDAADWTEVDVSLDSLEQSEATRCPCTAAEVMEYVRLESADTDEASEEALQFLRTARIGEARFWMWSYTESDGELCYVTVRFNPDRSVVTGLSDANGLSPEQYLLADYYDEIYW